MEILYVFLKKILRIDNMNKYVNKIFLERKKKLGPSTFVVVIYWNGL